jgi:hypothetical protein
MSEARADLYFLRFVMRSAVKLTLCRAELRNWLHFTHPGQRVRWEYFIKGTDSSRIAAGGSYYVL